MSQHAIFSIRLESQGKLPTQTKENMKHNVSEISLKIRKVMKTQAN